MQQRQKYWRRTALVALLIGSAYAAHAGAASGTATLDPLAVEFRTPEQIPWVANANGSNEQAVLYGDPGKPGPYVIRIRWKPGQFSRPHFHNGDRFFTVISGTWWVGTGANFDPARTVPMPAGSYVVHKAGQLHYDGAKDEETVIQVVGYGPLTTTPAAK